MAKLVTRRTALQLLGAGLGALSGACGPDSASPPLVEGDGSDADGTDTSPMDGALEDAGMEPGDGTDEADAAAGEPDAAAPLPSPEELLSTIDCVVVLMMENRSFDHMLGALRTDPSYAQRDVIDGLRGTESNLDARGQPVPVFKLENFAPADPPHDWEPVHRQWNQGRNDGFVTEHAGASEKEAMGFHDRSQIPFYYWLADNFTICDRWFCSVLGPTWPNRYYLHATTSGGAKDNSFGGGNFDTIWDRLKSRNLTSKNYFDGAVPWYLGGFLGKLISLNPTVGLSQFFADASAGTLPAFSLIDPDFLATDDHPDHDVTRGQAFIATIYKALTESPQWSRCLFVITYDEHGGFYDHVPPPATRDDHAEFAQLGFRVPALVIGPTVKKGQVVSTVLEHSSIAATLKTRFGIESLSTRMDASNHLASCIDPALYQNPSPPPADMPAIVMSRTQALHHGVGHNSQPQLDVLIETGAIPAALVDERAPEERIAAWLAHAERLGAVKLLP